MQDGPNLSCLHILTSLPKTLLPRRPKRNMAPAYYDESDEEPPRTRRPRQPAPRPREESLSRSPSPRPKATARKSAMRDPSQPRKRSNSEVRLNPPTADGNDSDESTNGYWVRHKDGKREFIHDSDPRAADLGTRSGGGRSKSSKVDLEAKNDPRDKKFRERRNGYESDEGETLKAAKPKRKEYDLPYRDRPKGRYDDDSDAGYRGAAAGAAGLGAGAAAGAASRRKKDDYDDDRRKPDPRERRRRYDDDDYDEPRSKPRRPPPEKGYDTDAPRQRPRWEDGDRYGERRGGGRRDDYGRDKRRSAYDDDPYYSDRRDDRRMPERTKSSKYPDDRDRYADRRRRDVDDRRVDKKKGDGDWKKTAGTLFMTQAMPIIKKEGTKMLQKEMARRFGG